MVALLPDDVEEVVVSTKDGTTFRWSGPAAEVVGRAIGVVSQAMLDFLRAMLASASETEGGALAALDALENLPLPAPTVTRCSRSTFSVRGRYCENLQGDAWIARELPPGPVGVESIVPKMLQGGGPKYTDGFGNHVKVSGPLCDFAITCEAARVEEKEETDAGG
jgi:hypothetical protein